MIRSFSLHLLLIALASAASSPSRVEAVLGKAANDDTCAVSQVGTTFHSEDRDVFARLLLRDVRPTDRVRVEWVSPSGATVEHAEYTDLPSARRLCVMNQLSVAGFPPASQPGRWIFRVLLRGRVEMEKPFVITGAPVSVSIAEVTVAATPDGRLQIDLTGSGFEPNSVAHIAQYTQLAAWQYFAAELPVSISSARMGFTTSPLGPGEYIVVVGTPSGALSAPARFLISSGQGYKLPTPAGERWIVTQGPYGSFSHWNRSIHAWDIAPESGRFVVAMRGGTVYTHDFGMGRTVDRRSFGNYITIDHGDGEYSHYAHLKSRSFVVRNGDRVEQGQLLALVGNSGYALGPGGGYHVHVHVTRSPSISSQSIPFSFEDLGARGARGFSGPVVSTNSLTAAAVVRTPVLVASAARSAGPAKPGNLIEGAVQPAEWWSHVINVPARSSELDVELSWTDPGSELDLHLVSPSGRHYGWYGDRRGYSGQRSKPETFTIRLPEPGQWRVAVQGISGAPGPTSFRIESRSGSATARARPRSRGQS